MSVDTDFLRKFLAKLQADYAKLDENFHESDFGPAALPSTSEDAERAARLADSMGLDGNTLRDLTPVADAEWTLAMVLRQLKREIELIPRVIDALENPDKGLIPEGTELLDIHQVARLLNMGESTVRGQDKKGNIPGRVRVDKSLRWSYKALLDSIDKGRK